MNRIRRNDFSYKILQPYVHGSLTRDTTKYFFQDARYGTYHANVATFFPAIFVLNEPCRTVRGHSFLKSVHFQVTPSSFVPSPFITFPSSVPCSSEYELPMTIWTLLADCFHVPLTVRGAVTPF